MTAHAVSYSVLECSYSQSVAVTLTCSQWQCIRVLVQSVSGGDFDMQSVTVY